MINQFINHLVLYILTTIQNSLDLILNNNYNIKIINKNTIKLNHYSNDNKLSSSINNNNNNKYNNYNNYNNINKKSLNVSKIWNRRSAVR